MKTLVEQDMQAGRHEAIWDGEDEKGEPVSSGMYLDKLKTGENSVRRRMVLVR